MTIAPFTPRVYSRSELGMRAPKRTSNDFTPEHGGVAIHYGGGGPNPAPTDFNKCKSIWLGWQNYHMDGHGWNDIAYSFGITNNGDIFTGRGIGVRSGAQGTNAGNQNFYAVVFIGGGDASVSERAKYAYKWLINQLRKVKDNAGKAVKPHKYFVDTSCAGPVLTPFALSLDGKDISGLGEVSGPAYTPPAFPLPSNHWYGVDDGTPYSHSGLLSRGRDDYWVRRIQKIVGTTVDGDYGTNTAKAVKVYVDKHVASTVSLGDRTKVGPKVWKVLF